ncbi:hypothetical protein SAMN05444266_101826 [Chitinophaga jiangningensis]|uniref:Outer membrane protein beta-barrel domain-containing protein n=1 Tax=Chitinophaga jiangningensis TaxID=1419482 RepID=A0A1M6WZJ8_9BACT|nr:DUF6048 family protein [Chitinophaga jiangningensis]SHK98995.1 hypothetical protein SAMN05444266_101826 [Chitinophaga jiangningensis]
MIRTFNFSFILSSCLFCGTLFAQKKTAAPAAKPAADTSHQSAVKKVTATPVKDSSWLVPGGLRIGVDLGRIVNNIYYPYRQEYTIVADARLNANTYAALEIGYTNTPYSDTNYTYKGNGMFATIGLDYNFLKRQYVNEKNMFFGGIRYGISHFNYEVPTYTIHAPYWGGQLSGSYPKTNVTAHWAELVLGLKTEVLKNFFLGWNVRTRILINNVDKDGFTPLTIPGFGSGSKNAVFDMQYTISYVLPFYKVRERDVPPKVKKPVSTR